MQSPSLPLTEQQVIDGFHSFLQTALAQARAERLLDADTLASAEADLMISGPALCLFFGALRSSTVPPSVPLPRSRSDKTIEPVKLSESTCPPSFLSFLKVWAAAVPHIQALPSSYQHDLARVICGLEPLSDPVNSAVNGIAADLRAVAIEISQRRTFQERYQADLQYALDTSQLGRGGRRSNNSATAHFVPPPLYSEKDSSSTGSRTPDPTPSPQPQTITFPEPELPPRPGPSRSPSIQEEPAIVLIRETLFASLGDVISKTPSLGVALKTDPARAYYSSVALAILDVSLHSMTPTGGVLGVLGKELTLDDCPEPLRPLMLELAAIGQEAATYANSDDENAIRLAARGKNIPEPVMDRVTMILETGVGYDNHLRAQEEDGRRSVEGRAVQFANRINKLALTMTGLQAFRSYAKGVFEVLSALA